jgi:hypothetical protein
MARRLFLVLVVLGACGDDRPSQPQTAPDAGVAGDTGAAGTGGGSDDAGGPPPDAGVTGGPDRGALADAPAGPPDELAAREDFFRTEIVHRIEITVDPAMWEAFMAIHRSFAPKPMNTWFRADFRVDGTTLRDVAFHSFGWGSRDYNKNKPNLSLDIDRIVPGQSLRGIERMRIKNNGQDLSGLRQAILYEAMRESNLMAPRSTYADLFVNGAPYGFYFVEESFTEGFARERTGNGDGAAYEPQGCQGFVSPSEGGCDNMPAWFTRPFNPTAGAGADLVALCRAMNGPPEQLLAALAPLILVSEWIDQIAIDTALAGDRDGFSVTASNFRLYHDTTLDKLRLIVLGPDDTFLPEHLPQPSFLRPEPDVGCLEDNPQFRDIFLEKLVATPQGLALYQQAVRRLRTGVLAATTVKQRVDALWAIVGSRALGDPLLPSYANMTDVLDSKQAIEAFVSRRWPALEQAGF